ncbi:MAG: hypothetical protein HY791_31635 [Deltaproteobacteria bacterium]|nr:hypothetical protein [Deltaproteobacteria bacterium]
MRERRKLLYQEAASSVKPLCYFRWIGQEIIVPIDAEVNWAVQLHFVARGRRLGWAAVQKDGALTRLYVNVASPLMLAAANQRQRLCLLRLGITDAVADALIQSPWFEHDRLVRARVAGERWAAAALTSSSDVEVGDD